MRGGSGGVTRTARTRYNVQQRGKWVGVEKRQARSIRQRCWMEYSAGFVVIEALEKKLSTDNVGTIETQVCRYIPELHNDQAVVCIKKIERVQRRREAFGMIGEYKMGDRANPRK